MPVTLLVCWYPGQGQMRTIGPDQKRTLASLLLRVDRKTSTSLHAQIDQALRARILSGAVAPGRDSRPRARWPRSLASPGPRCSRRWRRCRPRGTWSPPRAPACASRPSSHPRVSLRARRSPSGFVPAAALAAARSLRVDLDRSATPRPGAAGVPTWTRPRSTSSRRPSGRGCVGRAQARASARLLEGGRRRGPRRPPAGHRRARGRRARRPLRARAGLRHRRHAAGLRGGPARWSSIPATRSGSRTRATSARGGPCLGARRVRCRSRSTTRGSTWRPGSAARPGRGWRSSRPRTSTRWASRSRSAAGWRCSAGPPSSGRRSSRTTTTASSATAGRPLTALQGLDDAGRVVYIGTFSKTMFPGLRLGYLVVPPALVDVFGGARLAARAASALEQAALAVVHGRGPLRAPPPADARRVPRAGGGAPRRASHSLRRSARAASV